MCSPPLREFQTSFLPTCPESLGLGRLRATTPVDNTLWGCDLWPCSKQNLEAQVNNTNCQSSGEAGRSVKGGKRFRSDLGRHVCFLAHAHLQNLRFAAWQSAPGVHSCTYCASITAFEISVDCGRLFRCCLPPLWRRP